MTEQATRSWGYITGVGNSNPKDEEVRIPIGQKAYPEQLRLGCEVPSAQDPGKLTTDCRPETTIGHVDEPIS